MVYVIQLASRIRTLLCVQWKTADYGQRNCPKHVDFYSKNKFEKLVHLFGFIIRIYHDARSPEHQILYNVHYKLLLVHSAFRASFYILNNNQHLV